MKQINRKLIASLIILIVVAGIVAVILLQVTGPSDDKNTKNGKSDSGSTRTLTPLNPSDVVQQLPTYKNKTIALKGTINRLANKEYYIVGDGQPAGSIKLDFSKSSVNPSDYANVAGNVQNSTQKLTTKGPYTVTGKITQQTSKATTEPYSLIVQSIK